MKFKSVEIEVALAGLLFFGFAWVRHASFHSGAFDLGIFDQAAWLISRGRPPLSSFLGFPILGDHAAVIFYPIGWLYHLHGGPGTLFFLQALALASGAIPIYRLANRHLDFRMGRVLAAAYLLSPIVFNLDAFDFHPDALAMPGILWALELAEEGRCVAFLLACLLVLSCKEVLSLTVAAMGLRLWRTHGWRFGAVPVISGSGWFLVATQLIIPHFSGHAVAALARYAYLGNGFWPIALHLISRPALWLSHLRTGDDLVYAAMLLLPVAGGFALGAPWDLAPALPAFMLNLLSDSPSQTDLLHQYAAPILPFLFLATIRSPWTLKLLHSHPRRLARWTLGWALVGFLALSRWALLFSYMAPEATHLAALRQAMARIDPAASVITNHQVAPHLAHRSRIYFFTDATDLQNSDVQDILVDQAHPGWRTTRTHLDAQVAALRRDPRYRLRFDRDRVLLFEATTERPSRGSGA